jgi:hypothetical protein
MIDHVHDTDMANRIATLNRRVTQCRQGMSLSRSCEPNQNGTAVLLDEVAFEQAHDRGLGNPLRELEVVFSQGLLLGDQLFSKLFNRCFSSVANSSLSFGVSTTVSSCFIVITSEPLKALPNPRPVPVCASSPVSGKFAANLRPF